MIAEKYRLLRPLGHGGMGAVFEAENTWTTRRVALKVLLTHVEADPESASRFRREAQATAQLSHPNIVDVLDLGRDGRTGALFIVQELLRGTDLREHLEARGRLAVGEALDVIVPVVGALAAAHRQGVLHRDVKPANIFLAAGAGGPTPKLIDFGLAKLGVERDPSLTPSGAVLGTPNYMSPEQVRGESDVDGRADQWAVGAVLFQLLTGRAPFAADNANLVMVKVLTEAAPDLGLVAPEVPAPLAALVRRTLQADRDARFASMDALLDALLDAPNLPDSPEPLRVRHRASIERTARPPLPADIAAAETQRAPPLLAPAAPAGQDTPLGWVRTGGGTRRTRALRGVALGLAVALPLAVVWGTGRAPPPTHRAAALAEAARDGASSRAAPPLPLAPLAPAPPAPSAGATPPAQASTPLAVRASAAVRRSRRPGRLPPTRAVVVPAATAAAPRPPASPDDLLVPIGRAGARP